MNEISLAQFESQQARLKPKTARPRPSSRDSRAEDSLVTGVDCVLTLAHEQRDTAERFANLRRTTATTATTCTARPSVPGSQVSHNGIPGWAILAAAYYADYNSHDNDDSIYQVPSCSVQEAKEETIGLGSDQLPTEGFAYTYVTSPFHVCSGRQACYFRRERKIRRGTGRGKKLQRNTLKITDGAAARSCSELAK